MKYQVLADKLTITVRDADAQRDITFKLVGNVTLNLESDNDTQITQSIEIVGKPLLEAIKVDC